MVQLNIEKMSVLPKLKLMKILTGIFFFFLTSQFENVYGNEKRPRTAKTLLKNKVKNLHYHIRIVRCWYEDRPMEQNKEPQNRSTHM